MIVSQTPLRVSFAGGGTDFPEFYRHQEGVVVSTAIEQFIYVVVKRRFDNKIRVAYTRTETVDSPDELAHDLVRESIKKAGISGGIEVCTLADIPSEGSGLGSSSSLTVGLLNAFYAYSGKPCTAEILARDACEIELELLKRPMGKQDAYIAAYGGLNMFHFKPSEEVEVEPLSMRPESRRWLEEHLLLFFTGRTRRTENILGRQQKNLTASRENCAVLCDIAWELRNCMLNGLGAEFGKLLHRGWEAKKALADGISDTELDELYQRSLSAGAIGGKIAGAGGGGFMLLYCDPEKRDSVRQALAEMTEMPFRFEACGSRNLLHT